MVLIKIDINTNKEAMAIDDIQIYVETIKMPRVTEGSAVDIKISLVAYKIS